jgi:predicted dehydrogenase
MNAPTDFLRVALLGYGYAGKTFHAPLIEAVPGLKLTVVGSRQPAKVLADLPEVNVVAEPGAAATHPDVELVVIASPNETHVSLAQAALRAGKAVVVDKPFTVTLAEARGLAELATAQGRLLSVFHNRRWDSDFLFLRQLLAGGRLGEVLHFESHFDRYRPLVQSRWREQAVPGGGIWYDLGPHLIDQALQLFGLPQTVSATLTGQRPGAQATDWSHVLLDYGRRQVILHAAMLVAGGVPRYAAHGTDGSWIKFGLDTQEDFLKAGGRPGESGWGADPQHGTFYEGATGQTQQLSAPAGDYRQYYLGIHEAILHGGPNPVAPAQAIAVMAVLEAALESATTRRAAELPLTAAERALWT